MKIEIKSSNEMDWGREVWDWYEFGVATWLVFLTGLTLYLSL